MLLRSFIEAEEHLERIRSKLAMRRNFKLEDAYKSLAKDKDYIEPEDVKRVMSDRHMYCTDDEIKLFFKRFDKTDRELINFQEF